MDTLFKNTTYRILELFFDKPRKRFSAREIARTLKISHATVLKHLDLLKPYLKKESSTLYPTFHADTESRDYVYHKKEHILWRIRESGLVEHLSETYFPGVIILFGSCARGEHDERSDIDIYVEMYEKNIDLRKFEKILKHPINLLFLHRYHKISDELWENIINGTLLYGFFSWNGRIASGRG